MDVTPPCVRVVSVVAFWTMVVVIWVVTKGSVTELLSDVVGRMMADEELTQLAGAEPKPAAKGWTSTTEKSIHEVVGKKLASWN